jgi:hypothetical protein
MKLALIISLLFVGYVFAQEQNPNVELPDFVIFGQEDISVRKVDKIKPDYIPVVSNQFLRPSYKPDYLQFAEVSNPAEAEISLLDSADYKKGFIELAAGFYQLPQGAIDYTFPFQNGILHGYAAGLNQIAYVDNSQRQMLEGALDFAYTLPTDINALPGTKFALNAAHTKYLFRFFGSVDPERERNLNIGSASATIQNLYMKEFIFDLNGGGDFTYLDDEYFNESLLYANAFGRLNIKSMNLNVKAAYQHQNLTTDSLNNSKTDAYYFRPTVSLEIFDKIMLEGGFTFSAGGGQHLNTIYASLSTQLTKSLLVYGEYSPIGENLTAGKFMRDNFYYDQININRVFLKKENKFKALVKYEYDKYYQIDAGVEYFNTDNLPYYNNTDTSGFFEVLTSDAMSWNIFLNMLYYVGPYGYFYGTVNYFSVENSDSKKIPYNPEFTATLIYGYNFNKEWNAEAKIDYLSDRYADLENDENRKLPDIFNLGLKISYTYQTNFGLFFALENILNMKRDTWEGYQEKPIEALLGVNYFFD